jgi:hypothetical protein
MPECICPSCKTFFSAPSSIFGETYNCNSCGAEFKLDIVHLAHYELPSIIRIQLKNPNGTPFTRFSVPVMVNYGYRLPPLRSNSNGLVLITKEMFLKAQRDEISTGIMDYKGDYSLNRFIHIGILGHNESIAAANARSNSGWPILDFEKELYSDFGSLVAAYLLDENIAPADTNIDISQPKDIVELELIIKTL